MLKPTYPGFKIMTDIDPLIYEGRELLFNRSSGLHTDSQDPLCHGLSWQLLEILQMVILMSQSWNCKFSMDQGMSLPSGAGSSLTEYLTHTKDSIFQFPILPTLQLGEQLVMLLFLFNTIIKFSLSEIPDIQFHLDYYTQDKYSAVGDHDRDQDSY
jgi:hypothetical protein